jgi:hypothetical protein
VLFTLTFSDGVALVGRFVLLPLGDFSRGGDLAVFSRVGDLAAFSPARGLFALADRLPDAGLFAFAC